MKKEIKKGDKMNADYEIILKISNEDIFNIQAAIMDANAEATREAGGEVHECPMVIVKNSKEMK